MEKFKAVSGGGGIFGGGGDNKAQAWLDGFLKIPLTKPTGRYIYDSNK